MKKKRFGSWKLLLTVVVVAALLAAVLFATGVFASLGDTTGVVTVRPGSVSCEVAKDYSIKNTGSIPVLVRAKVVINWLDDEGHILATKPADAKVTVGAPSGWTHWPANADAVNDGYWFYNGVAEAGQSLPFLGQIHAEGGRVKVTVLAEAVQASPAEAAAEIWGMTFNGSTWNAK